MANENNPKPECDTLMTYQIRIKGHLNAQWAGWFGAITITREANGITRLTCAAIDQAALHGVLKKVRDLGVPLISVSSLDPEPIEKE